MSLTAQEIDQHKRDWKDTQRHMHAVANSVLCESNHDLTALDQSADNLRDVADRIERIISRGHDPLHDAAVVLAEASVVAEKVHGELVFDPRPLEDSMVDLPIRGEWHPRGEVPMSTTLLPVVVPRPETETDTVERGALEPGTAAWRAYCRDRVQAVLDYHRGLFWEGLLPNGNGSEGGH